ncbi:hypothetical protein NPIL_45181 [Nephila pilipes]|uniref:Uncharacterized protein n=1 Tax=Nephila pilipes TaxID=299642 RepID=A0A8X6P1Y9_NEPPI|nr:hypothetical protein NPIL_45181 [Nephila pilipes]
MAWSRRKLRSEHPSFSRNPFWKGDNRELIFAQELMRAASTKEKTFPPVFKSETGLQFEISEGSPGFGINTTFASFQEEGTAERSRTLLKTEDSTCAPGSRDLKLE